MISDDCAPSEKPWRVECPECDGSGEVYSLPSERYDPRKCPECGGKGEKDV